MQAVAGVAFKGPERFARVSVFTMIEGDDDAN
jgi:hypothetical protein